MYSRQYRGTLGLILRPICHVENWWQHNALSHLSCTVKPHIFVRYLFSYFHTFAVLEKAQNLMSQAYENLFLLWDRRVSTSVCFRPSKVRKLVCTNQFQVKNTKMGTGRKFVTLQYAVPKRAIMARGDWTTKHSVNDRSLLQNVADTCMNLSDDPTLLATATRTVFESNLKIINSISCPLILTKHS